MSAFVEFPVELYNKSAFAKFKEHSDFSIDNAFSMMWLAQLAYETRKPATIAQVQQLWKFDSITQFVEQGIFQPEPGSDDRYNFDTRGIIAEKGEATFIAFAGTDFAIWENVWTDFDFKRNETTDTHRGFQAAFDAIAPKIDAAIRVKRKHLFFVGHSLGGALAVLAAKKALDDGIEATAVYTFGQPRVGGKQFATRYDSSNLGNKTYRVVHGIDVVPRVPPAALRFVHVGHMLYCKPWTDFAAGPLAPLGSNKPTLFTGVATFAWEFLKRLSHGWLLAPPGPGELGPLFRLLPLPVREHLEDRYLIALGDLELAGKLNNPDRRGKVIGQRRPAG